MLERVPAAAESTAHFFIRSVEKPVRSSRVLDPRFWRNGADDLESSAWWPSYLQRIRAVPQSRQSAFEDNTAILCSSPARLAKSTLLQQRYEPVLHPAVTVQSQQIGATFRSFSVSTTPCQSASPRVAETFTDTSDHEQSIVATSRDTSEEQDKFQRNTQKENGHSREHGSVEVQQPSYPKLPVARASSNHRAQSKPHDLDAFDLTADATPDWLGSAAVWQQTSRPSRQSHIRDSDRDVSSISFAPAQSSSERTRFDAKPLSYARPKPRKKNKTPEHSAKSYIPFESFDLHSLQKGSSQLDEGVFDLNADTQQDHFDDDDFLDSRPDSGHTSYSRSTSIELHDDGSLKSRPEANLLTGWNYSNPFAALVPEEVFDLVEDVPRSQLMQPEKYSKEDDESFHLPEEQAKAIDQHSKEMVDSVEARSTTLLPFDSNPRDEEKPVLASEHDTTAPNRERQDPKQARFNALVKVRTEEGTATQLLDEAWSLFLSFDNQETYAPHIFRLLNQSTDDKYLSRALAAFNTIPRPRRTKAMYQAAVDIELKRHQHGSAINLAFEANIKGFNVLPSLLAYLIKNLLWNSVAELLHRNKDARRDFAQFAAVPELSTASPKNMLSLYELLEECSRIPDLHAKILSLAERVQSSDSAFTEHIGLLKRLCQRLTIQAVLSSNAMIDITPQALIAILNLEDLFGNLGLHEKSLDTIFQLHKRSDRFDLALMVYRHFRYKHPSQTPNSAVIKKLISLCGDAEQVSFDLYDYLLEQFARKPDRTAYHQIMTYCARAGDAMAVRRYFQRLINNYGRPERAALVNPLIHAYAVVGDVPNARKQFNQISTTHGLVPDTVSWNMLMLAHLHSGDDVSAFDVHEEMRKNDVKANEYTYGQLLAVCAAHGDTEAALDILVDARDDRIAITVPMINTVVETYLRNNNPQAAMKFALAALGSENQKALTRLWNSLVRYFAFQGRLNELMKIRDMMARYNIASDGMTYAPIMTLLTSLQQTTEALQLLRRMQQEQNLPSTMFHYTIVLNGFVAEGNRDMAAVVFNEMKQRFPAISASANAAMLYLQTRRDTSGYRDGSELENIHGVRMLAELLKDISSVKGSPLNSASAKSQKNGVAMSMYFETVIRALIRSGSHDLAAELMKHVNVTMLAVPGAEPASLPASRGMVLAQMDIAMERQDWSEFDQIFNSAFQSAVEGNRSIPIIRKVQETEQEKPLAAAKAAPHARYSLSSMLNRYMEAMARQFRQAEVLSFIRTKLSRSGFAFTGKNWNKYVQVLCRSRRSEHQLKAFVIFEKNMRTKAQSWDLLARGKIKKKSTNYLWQPYGQRNRPILQKRNTYRIAKRSDELYLRPERRTPTYLTAVHLGAVLIQAHHRVQQGHPKQFELIRKAAPKTKRFVQYMPRLKDGIQGSILRQLSKQNDSSPRPRSELSISGKTDLVGVAGDQSPLNQMPLDFLDDVDEIVGRDNVVRSLLKDHRASRGQAYQVRTDIEIGEMFTGQISRAPLVLAGKGRLENVTEMEKRIAGEERYKQRIAARLRQDLRARRLTGDILRPPLLAESQLRQPKDQKLDVLSKQPRMATDSLLVSSRNVLGSMSNNSVNAIPVKQQLDELAEQRTRRNKELEAKRMRAPAIPQLAVPFMNLRRLRRRLALGQRKKARQRLEEMKGELSPSAYIVRAAAAKRLEAFEQAQRRRRAVIAYERDLKKGVRLDPFPKTLRSLETHRFHHGPVRVRFTPDLGRKKKNYLVRRGEIYDRRQRQVQTVPSRKKNYITRFDRLRDRTRRWQTVLYGLNPTLVRERKEAESR